MAPPPAFFTALDLLLAAAFAAWFLSFATTSRAKDSLARMMERSALVRSGALAAAGGLVVLMAATVLEAMGEVDTGMWINVGAYPAWFASVWLLASATWRPLA